VTSGEILIGDRVVNHLPPRERDIAMVFQDYALYPHKTVRENMGFSLKVRGIDARDAATRIDEAAAMLGIAHLLDRRPGQLSGGQRQRVAMGRAIVRRPQVFLFDEPLSNLDAKLRGQVRTEIKKLHQAITTTIIYVTHDQVEAMTLADRIVILKGGAIEQVGTPDEVYNRPASIFVGGFVGAPAMNFVRARVQSGDAVCEGGGDRIPLAAVSRGRSQAMDSRDIFIGVRPEHVTAGNHSGVSLSGRVEVVEPLGSDTLVHFALGKAVLTARMPPSVRPKVGEMLHTSVDPAQVYLFDAATERAIA
jgi:multiple sugar transport system ATP-binding protein